MKKYFFQKTECLVKAIKKFFLKKLSIWLTLIKVVILVINYQKGKEQNVYIYIYKGVYFILSINFLIIIIIIIIILGIGRNILLTYLILKILMRKTFPLKLVLFK